ncbi:gamma-glutamylcyclotransferase [Parahaliea maris]|uniref:Putative gamma-glutamylcyclotransferase n=2 Tax=Parahaliea maris TaxID=2716870 RepID=A0A5C8ZX33_9GAMM|nr:gamma-glutamylcyclotransferase [Parahaliea maris]
MERLFVYGTLAPGRSNHYVLEDISGNWEAATLTAYMLDEGWGLEQGFPGIVPSDEGKEVRGSVFSSDHLSEYWSMIDEFEGSDYQRVLVQVRIESDEVIEAYVYALAT